MEIKQEKITSTIENGKKVKNKYLTKKKAPYILGYALTMLLMLTMSFIGSANFDPANLTKWEWWVPNLVCAIAVVMCINTRLREKISELEAQSTDINEINTLFFTKVKESKFKSEDLEQYIILQNRKTKKETYQAIIGNKLGKLNRSRFVSLKMMKLYNEGSAEEKAKSRYCQTRAKLEYLMSDEYLDKNLDCVRCDYNKWTYPMLLAGIESSSVRKHQQTKEEYIQTNSAKKAVSKIIFPILMTTIALTMDFKDWSSLVTMLTRMGSVVFSLLTADQLAETFVNVNLKRFAFERVEYFTNFESWKNDKIIQDKKVETETEAKAVVPDNNEIKTDKVLNKVEISPHAS